MTPEEMAEALELSPTTIRNYLGGRTKPKFATIESWALRCGVPLDWLRTGALVSTGGTTPSPDGQHTGDSFGIAVVPDMYRYGPRRRSTDRYRHRDLVAA